MSRPAITVHDLAQRSPEWLKVRCGRLCGSQAGDMLAKIKTGEAAARRDLRMRHVVERLTGIPQEDGYQNADMKRGIELEDAAFRAYEAITGVLVRRVGFVTRDDMLVGFSPDGVIGDFEGLLEIKVPRSANHLRYVRGKQLPSEYVGQVTHGMFVTGARYVDFCSFDPRFPEPLQVFRIRAPRDEAVLKSYELAVSLFLSEVEREVDDVRSLIQSAA